MNLIYLIIFLILIYSTIYILKNPTLALIPYNLLIDTIHPRKVFYTEDEKNILFPSLKLLEKFWKNIKKEAINVMNISENIGKKFINESDEFWEGWTTFPLRLFGKDYIENQNKCPVTKELLKDPEIISAFFSIMKPGKTLPSHYGPFKGILRYHLGLLVPPKEAGNCFISVDDQIYEWKEGEGILFDETHKHFVKNETIYPRIVLFIDVKRPMYSNIMRYINNMIIWLMGHSPY